MCVVSRTGSTTLLILCSQSPLAYEISISYSNNCCNIHVLPKKINFSRVCTYLNKKNPFFLVS